MIKAEGLQFAYNRKTRFSFPTIDCEASDELLILGASGIGKTTLLHLLAGFLTPQKGAVEVSGNEFSKLKGNERDKFRANNIGFVYQDNYFINSISLFQNLVLAQTLAGNKKDTEKIISLASQLEIGDLLNKQPSDLSRGEKQRASIVRSLVNSPKVLLADEPTSSLDDNNCERVIRMIKEQAKENNAALIIVTHDQRLKSQFKNTVAL
ncbi:MAG: ATP-binding cassette domain-containing protein [Flavobacteriales bacterium]|nr:ATP-binding cassette domain-containing protein [Flavobacteriales bacterium]